MSTVYSAIYFNNYNPFTILTQLILSYVLKVEPSVCEHVQPSSLEHRRMPVT